MLNDILGTAQDNRWDTMGLEIPGCQTHGLVANRSVGGKNSEIELILC